MSTLGTLSRYNIGCNICNIFDQKLCPCSGNVLRTPQVRRVSTLAWRVKSVYSDHKYWPPLETAVGEYSSWNTSMAGIHN